MDNQEPHFELPPVQQEAPKPVLPEHANQAPTPEVLTPPMDASNQSGPSVPIAAPTSLPYPTTPLAPANQAPAQSPQAVVPVAPAAADDTDLIEKAWVDKAKEIVDRTREDPYLQNKEINKFKADYIKKRYNKDIKLNED